MSQATEAIHRQDPEKENLIMAEGKPTVRNFALLILIFLIRI